MGAGTLVGGGGRAGRTGEPGWSGEHIPETAATEGSPAGCEAGRWAQVIPSLVFHHIHWMGKGREGENELAQTPGSTGPTPQTKGELRTAAESH